MILLVDIGNSAIKWVTSDNLEKINNFETATYKNLNFSDVLAKNWQSMDMPERIVVSSVAGNKIADQLTQWANQNWQIKPEFIKVENNLFDVKLAYEDINQFGVDRWLAIIAARKKYDNTLCIVDCGTAITIDGLSNQGLHLGGFIIPGIRLMQDSLCSGTQAITSAGNIKGKKEFANNTQQGIASGTTFAIISLIERVIHDMKTETRDDITCVITGRGAEQISHLFSINIEFDPFLVLQGLAWVIKEKL